MKFAMSYSCGKDSALTLYKLIKAGNEPVCLIVTINEDAGRSWFHGVDERLLEKVSAALGLPLIAARCKGEEYNSAFESALRTAAELGAECCAFGDIDIEGHLDWNRERCAAAGLECLVPLWGITRETAVSELLEAGFEARIKCVDKRYLDSSFLGKALDRALIEEIRETGADICGENGEYHTFVCSGPIFREPVEITIGDIVDLDTHAAIDIR